MARVQLEEQRDASRCFSCVNYADDSFALDPDGPPRIAFFDCCAGRGGVASMFLNVDNETTFICGPGLDPVSSADNCKIYVRADARKHLKTRDEVRRKLDA